MSFHSGFFVHLSIGFRFLTFLTNVYFCGTPEFSIPSGYPTKNVCSIGRSVQGEQEKTAAMFTVPFVKENKQWKRSFFEQIL